MSLHVLIIDDHAVFRSGLGALLRMAVPGVEVLEAAALTEVLHAEMPMPQVALLDIQLHGLNGLDGLPLLARKWPQVPVVVLSSDTAPETAVRAKAQGAAAFVTKEKTAEDILAVIQEVLGNSAIRAPRAASTAATGEPQLTPRQYEVLDLLCQGLPNKAIGRKLGLSENTVRGHVQAILGALQVANRSEAAFAARRRGLIR
jgi:DNA-binding NarL/FixJ family response regulator